MRFRPLASSTLRGDAWRYRVDATRNEFVKKLQSPAIGPRNGLLLLVRFVFRVRRQAEDVCLRGLHGTQQ